MTEEGRTLDFDISALVTAGGIFGQSEEEKRRVLLLSIPQRSSAEGAPLVHKNGAVLLTPCPSVT